MPKLSSDNGRMNWYDRHVLPWLIDIACGLPMVQAKRRQLVPQARGRVLEIGMGTGRNLPFYDRAPDPALARWQERIQPYWMPVAGGCHLDRDVPALLREAGLNGQVDQGYLSGPRLLTYHFWGQAQKT